jgi:hypothetical protein
MAAPDAGLIPIGELNWLYVRQSWTAVSGNQSGEELPERPRLGWGSACFRNHLQRSESLGLARSDAGCRPTTR